MACITARQRTNIWRGILCGSYSRSEPFPDELLLTNFGLFSALLLWRRCFLHECYEKIKSIPGDIFVFGVWLGQDVVLFESLRAMLEPYNASRKIVGFDTFEGYQGISDQDRSSDVIKPGGYTTHRSYQQYLGSLLAYHRLENMMGHAVTHRLVQGMWSKRPLITLSSIQTMVALAYFDMALYEPTRSALNSLSDRLMPGSIIVLDELNDPKYPGETVAFREWVASRSYTIERSKILPDRTIVTIK